MLYEIFKIVHLLGVVILIGNVTITAFWKVFADRRGNPVEVAFAQRMVTITDWVFTLAGIVMIVVGGYGMLYVIGMSPFEGAWLIWSQIMFAIAGLIWLVVLIPAQIRQGRTAKTFAAGGDIPDTYRRDATLWIVWGVIATVPLAVGMVLMVLKPV